jgi:hypothetical protein
VRVLFSFATDVGRYRLIGRGVIDRINQMFTYNYRVPVRAIQWEYAQDIPGLSPKGHIADRSREIVAMSQLVILILGTRLGEISAEEIRAALESRQRGDYKELWLFRWTNHSDDAYEQLRTTVISDFEEEFRWTPFGSGLDLQGLLFTSLIPHLMRAVTPSYAPTAPGLPA